MALSLGVLVLAVILVAETWALPPQHYVYEKGTFKLVPPPTSYGVPILPEKYFDLDDYLGELEDSEPSLPFKPAQEFSTAAPSTKPAPAVTKKPWVYPTEKPLPSKPSHTYGVPPEHSAENFAWKPTNKPKGYYELPAESTEAPEKPASTYGLPAEITEAPEKPASTYGLPAETTTVKPAKPQGVYGLPDEKIYFPKEKSDVLEELPSIILFIIRTGIVPQHVQSKPYA